MKGNITKRIFAQKVVLIISAILIVLLIFLLIFTHGCTSNKETTGSSHRTLPDIKFADDDGFTSGANTGVDIPATTGIVFQQNVNVQDVRFYNPESNPCIFIITIYLSDGTMVYKSNPICPGEYSNGVILLVGLQQGIYRNALLVYDCCSLSDISTIVTRCEIPIEIKCS